MSWLHLLTQQKPDPGDPHGGGVYRVGAERRLLQKEEAVGAGLGVRASQ